MEKKSRIKIKHILLWVVILLVVALLAALPFLTKNDGEDGEYVASILSGTVENGDVAVNIAGGGTLVEDDAMDVTVPTGVEITEYLVSDGDIVKEDDALATVDRLSVMNAITEIQDNLEYLSEEIVDASDEAVLDKITAEVPGRVKAVYAEEGDNVVDVMLEHGALAVVSIDGLMAVEIETDAAVVVGDAVTVVLSDGTEVDGRVKSSLDQQVIVTLTDDGPALGEEVQVLTADGQTLGTGALYVHNAWHIIGTEGIVSDVYIEAEDKISSGKKLFDLDNVLFSSELELLTATRREYEELMIELFVLYQDVTLTAPCDGVISGLDESLLKEMMAKSTGLTLTPMANAPTGDPDAQYQNYVGKVVSYDQGAYVMKMQADAIAVTDYLNLTGLNISEDNMTVDYSVNSAAPVYACVGGVWSQLSTVNSGDWLMFACDDAGNIVWIVRIKEGTPVNPNPEGGSGETPAPNPEGGNGETPAPGGDGTVPGTGDGTVPGTGDGTVPGTGDGTVPGTGDGTIPGTGDGTIPGTGDGTVPGTGDGTVPGTGDGTVPGTGAMPGTGTGGSMTGGFTGGFTGGGSMGSFGSFSGSTGMVVEEETYELFEIAESTLMSVIPQEKMQVQITVDELDVVNVYQGQSANITIDALIGQSFEGTVVDVDSAGTNSGGNTKYTVTVEFDRGADMLAGMNASVILGKESVEDITLIPVKALAEENNKTIVYTGYDEENDCLINPVEVELGMSDGENVQVISGLNAGDTYWYAYYDTLPITFEFDMSMMPR